jgi:hypothetical protein
MTDELFEQLLQKFMFGTLSADERRRLEQAALESPERSRELAQAEDVQDHFADPEFRRELIDALPQFVAPQEPARIPWWQTLFRPAMLVPVAGGAAVVVALLVIRDTVWRDEPSAQRPSVTATAPVVPPAVIDRGIPAPPTDAAQPASISAAERAMAGVFAMAASRPANFTLSLPNGDRYRPAETVEVRVTLPASGIVHAVVRGPDGHLREVFRTSGEDSRVAGGEHTFAFPAAGRMDPSTGGRSTMRVLFVAGDSPPADDRWEWLTTNATFQEASYDVGL